MLTKNHLIVEEKIDDIVYIFDLQNDVCLEFNEVSMKIWELVETHDINDIIDIIFASYDVDINILKNDANKFIELLVEKNILLL